MMPLRGAAADVDEEAPAWPLPLAFGRMRVIVNGFAFTPRTLASTSVLLAFEDAVELRLLPVLAWLGVDDDEPGAPLTSTRRSRWRRFEAVTDLFTTDDVDADDVEGMPLCLLPLPLLLSCGSWGEGVCRR